MAFAKKEFRLLGAPLNYQTPGDKIGERFSLRMENFRIDGKGRLFCRRGIERVGSATLSSIHTLMKAGDVAGVYVGAGGDLLADDGQTSLGAAFDGEPIGFATAGEFSWFMNRNGPKKRKGGGALQDWSILTPTAPIGSVTADVAGSLSGTYQVYVTFVNVTGGESNPSEGFEVTFSNNLVSMSGIPTSPDSQVVKRRIYIGGGTLGATYLLIEINDNTTTSLNVDRTETQLTDLGIIMPTNHDPVPDARVLAGPYFQRLIMASSEDLPNAYWWTETNEYDFVPATNVNFIGGADTDILAITHHGRQLNFYKPEGVWRLQNDPATTGDQEQTNTGFGPIGPKAVVAAGAVDYFVGPRGVFLMDGDRAIEISEPIRPIFEDERFAPIQANFVARPLASDPAARAKTICSWDGHRLYVSYAEQFFTEPNRTLIYDPQRGEWTHHRIHATIDSNGGFAAFAYDPATDKIVVATSNGKLYRLDHTFDDDGNGISVEYFSHYDDFGLPDNEKVVEDLVVEGNTRGENLVVKLHFDDGKLERPLATFMEAGFGRRVYSIRDDAGAGGRVGQRCRNVAVELMGDIAAPEGGMSVDSVILHYRVEVRESRTFDSGPIDLGTWQVKGIAEFELEIESITEVTWTLSTDLPQKALTERDTDVFSSTGGNRASRFLKLPTVHDGHRMQFTLESAVPFRLYSLWIRFHLWGEFVSGDAGDCYESEPLSLAG